MNDRDRYLLALLKEAKQQKPTDREWQQAINALIKGVEAGRGEEIADTAGALLMGRRVGASQAEPVMTEDGRLVILHEDGTTAPWEDE